MENKDYFESEKKENDTSRQRQTILDNTRTTLITELDNDDNSLSKDNISFSREGEKTQDEKKQKIKLSEHTVGRYKILDTGGNSKNIAIMFPNFNCSFPAATGDFLEGDDKSISFYGEEITPFTQALGNIASKGGDLDSADYRILEFNYPTDGNFDVDEIVDILKKYIKLEDKNITLYGQSMGGKTAIIVTSKLINQGYDIGKIVLNSSIVNPDSVALPIKFLPSGIEASLLKLVSLIPSKYLVGILSAAKNDKDLELDKKELVKVADNVKSYKIKWKQFKSRLNFIKQNLKNEIVSPIQKSQIPILALRSMPLVKDGKKVSNDGMVKSIFVDQLQQLFPGQVILEDVIAGHSQVPEKNSRYTKALNNLAKSI